jgi:Ni/Co efflux regulator RcnB
MKIRTPLALALALLVTQATFATPQDDHERQDRDDKEQHWDRKDHDGDKRPHEDHDNDKHNGWEKQAYRRGDRLPDRYYSNRYYVTDYKRYDVPPPRPGYRWVRDDDGRMVMIAISTGLIADIVLGH